MGSRFSQLETESIYKYYIIIYKCSTAAPRHQHLLGGAMRGGSGGAGGPGSPDEDHRSVSADPFGSRSAAAYRKSPPGLRSGSGSRCVSARPGHPRSRGPAQPTHRDGLSTRSCGSEASSFSLTAPRMIKISPRTGCVGLLRSRITWYFARDLAGTSKQNKISNFSVIFSRFIAEAFSVSTETADRPPPRQRIEPRPLFEPSVTL